MRTGGLLCADGDNRHCYKDVLKGSGVVQAGTLGQGHEAYHAVQVPHDVRPRI